MDTPWGTAEHVRKIAEHVTKVSTESHGGVRLTGPASRAIPDEVAAKLTRCEVAGTERTIWAEEDCEIAVALSLLIHAGLFDPTGVFVDTPAEKIHEDAFKVAANYMPEAIQPLAMAMAGNTNAAR